MSKKKQNIAVERTEPTEAETSPPVETGNGARPSEPQYAFPTKGRCPRCQTTDNVAESTQGKWQYRRCRRATCQRKFRIEGTPV
jgi:hypothetical protein